MVLLATVAPRRGWAYQALGWGWAYQAPQSLQFSLSPQAGWVVGRLVVVAQAPQSPQSPQAPQSPLSPQVVVVGGTPVVQRQACQVDMWTCGLQLMLPQYTWPVVALQAELAFSLPLLVLRTQMLLKLLQHH